jgi:hypothetical protein
MCAQARNLSPSSSGWPPSSQAARTSSAMGAGRLSRRSRSPSLEAVVQAAAEGLGGLGRVLGDVAGHLLRRQLPGLAIGPGDVVDVELGAPLRVPPGCAVFAGQGTRTAGTASRRASSRTAAVKPPGGGARQPAQRHSVATSRRMTAWKWTAPRRWNSATLAYETRTSWRSSLSWRPTSRPRARWMAMVRRPSFDRVHTRKAQGRLVLPCHPYRQGARCPHGLRDGCWHRHDPDDPRLACAGALAPRQR